MERLQEDPRIVRTRNLIINAFLKLIKEKAFESISVKDITELATINRATFYRHFLDKYALLDKVLIKMMENKGFEKIKDHTKLDEKTFYLLIDSFDKLIVEFKATFGRNYETVLVLTDSKIKDQLIDIISPLSPLNEIDQNKLIATMLVMSIHSATCSWIGGNKPISREAFLETILPFLMGSISQLS
jgi:AcrR family transcriptional regulator